MPTSINPRAYALVIGFAAVSASAAAQEVRQHGSHEHGAAQLNIAVAEQTLAVEFMTPAVNIVGFEHAARTQAQKQALHEAEELLQSDQLFALPAAAGCTLAHAEVEREVEEHADHDEHEEHEKEHAEHAGDEETHSELHVEYEYRCDNIAALTHMDVRIFEHFPGNEEIAVQAVTPTGQKGSTLTPDSARVLLR